MAVSPRGIGGAFWDRLSHFLTPPVFADVKMNRQANAIRAVAVACGAGTLSLAAAIPALKAPWFYGAGFITAVLLCFIGVIQLAGRGRVRAASLLLPLILWCALLVLGLFGGGILSLAFPLLTLVILSSSLLGGPARDALFIPLNVAAGALYWFLSARGLLPAPLLPADPLTLWVGMGACWFLAGSLVFLSRRGPLELIIGTRQRDGFLVEQAAQLNREVEQRTEAERLAKAKAASLLAASRMTVECATAPRGTDPLRLIGEQIHAVTGAVATVISTFDAARRELRARHVVIREPLRSVATRIVGTDLLETTARVPPGWEEETIRRGIVESTDLESLTFGKVPGPIALALMKALRVERYTSIALLDGERIRATVLVALAPGAPALAPEVAEIFSRVAAMLLRQKKAEDSARENESRFTEMVDQLPQPVIEMDAAGTVSFANAAARSVFGTGFGDERLSMLDAVAPEDRHGAITAFSTLRAGRAMTRSQFTFIRGDGGRFPAVVSARPLVTDDPVNGVRVTGVRGVLTDITSIRLAEERMRDSQEMLRLVLDLVPQSLFWKDRDSVYLGGNQVFAERAGLSRPEDAVGLTDGDMPWRAHAARARESEKRIMETGVPKTKYVENLTSSRGANRTARLSKFPLHNAQGEILGTLGISEDITDWVNAEAERLLLGTAIEKAVDSVVITDVSGAIQYVNPVFLRNYGYAREEVMGRTPRILKSGRHDAEYYRDMWTVIASGRAWQGRFHNRKKDGASLIEEAIISPVVDPNGAVSHYVKVARDVTYEVSLEQRYQQAQKMEAVGRLAGGVAHDFNNILTIITGYSDMIATGLSKDGAWQEEIAAISEAAARASTLTAQLLTFSRKQNLEPQVIDLNAVVRGIERMLRRLIGEDIVLTTELEPSLEPLFVDKGQMEQVLLNLAVNARDAMPQGGCLRLGTRRHACAPRPLEAHPGECAVLTVSDTGTGMTEEVKAHIFEPFFTTKPEHKGTGLGLATVYGIVAQSGGYIEVESRIGEGTQFRIFFPFAQEKVTSAQDAASPASAEGGYERILLVEDDAPIRRLMQRSLHEKGFTVTEAPDAASALDIFRTRPRHFQLLVTDVVMPHCSGPELAEIMRAEQPDIRVLFVSGYTANETVEHGVPGNEATLLQKPFTMQTLARRVREALDRR